LLQQLRRRNVLLQDSLDEIFTKQAMIRLPQLRLLPLIVLRVGVRVAERIGVPFGISLLAVVSVVVCTGRLQPKGMAVDRLGG
jgi:hypothetical protein